VASSCVSQRCDGLVQAASEKTVPYPAIPIHWQLYAKLPHLNTVNGGISHPIRFSRSHDFVDQVRLMLASGTSHKYASSQRKWYLSLTCEAYVLSLTSANSFIQL
jgi:hypothetical protein